APPCLGEKVWSAGAQRGYHAATEAARGTCWLGSRVRPTTLLQQPSTRRQFLRASALAGAGLALGQFLRLRALAADRPPTAEACILIFLNGGMSHLDTFDPKPDQPAEIRGEFGTIRTSAPGITITEPWPLMAQQAHHLAVVRSVGFEGRLGNHSPACYHM